MTKLHGYEIKVGDIVYDIHGNPLEVTNINSIRTYPIFAGNTSYTENGMYVYDTTNKNPSIFWQPPNIKEALELAKIKPNQKVTKYKVVYKNRPMQLKEAVTGDYYLDADDFCIQCPSCIFICLVKELSKEFEE